MNRLALMLLLVFQCPELAAESSHPSCRADCWLKLSSGLIIMDWGQTRDIARTRSRYETNPILGTHPTRQDVDLYFAAMFGANLMAHHFIIPARWREPVQIFISGMEVGYVSKNHRLGLRISF